MKNGLMLDPDMMANLAGCKVGDEKTLSVPVRVTAYGKTGASFEITGPPTISPVDDAEELETETEEPYSPAVGAMLA